MAPFDFWEVILARSQMGKDCQISSVWLARAVSSPCRWQPIKRFAGVRYTCSWGLSILLLRISHWQRSLLITGVVIWGVLAAWLRGSEVCVLKWKANGAKEKHIKRDRDPGAESQTVCWSRGDAAGGSAVSHSESFRVVYHSQNHFHSTLVPKSSSARTGWWKWTKPSLFINKINEFIGVYLISWSKFCGHLNHPQVLNITFQIYSSSPGEGIDNGL